MTILESVIWHCSTLNSPSTEPLKEGHSSLWMRRFQPMWSILLRQSGLLYKLKKNGLICNYEKGHFVNTENRA